MDGQKIDVGDGRKRFEREQEDLPNGHCVEDRYIIPVVPSSSEETFYFDRTFDFNCPKIPTSWSLRITFTRFQGKEVSVVSNVRRTDQAPGSVVVRLCTTVGDLTSPDACANHTFNGMIRGKRAFDSAKDIIARFDADRSVGRNLPVACSLAVSGCHHEQDMAAVCTGTVETMDTGDSEGSSVRKREDAMDTDDSSPRKRLRV